MGSYAWVCPLKHRSSRWRPAPRRRRVGVSRLEGFQKQGESCAISFLPSLECFAEPPRRRAPAREASLWFDSSLRVSAGAPRLRACDGVLGVLLGPPRALAVGRTDLGHARWTTPSRCPAVPRRARRASCPRRPRRRLFRPLGPPPSLHHHRLLVARACANSEIISEPPSFAAPSAHITSPTVPSRCPRAMQGPAPEILSRVLSSHVLSSHILSSRILSSRILSSHVRGGYVHPPHQRRHLPRARPVTAPPPDPTAASVSPCQACAGIASLLNGSADN